MPGHPYGLLASGAQAFRIETKLDAVLAQLGIVLKDESLVLKMETAMSKELDDLTAEVAADTAVESSAVTLINGLAAQIAAAGTDPAKLQALTDSLTSSSTALAAAVAANTAPPAA